MNKEMPSAPKSVKFDWEGNPKVRPQRAEFKGGVKAPQRKEYPIRDGNPSAKVSKGDGKMVEKIPVTRQELVIGKRGSSPKVLSKYSSKDGSISTGKGKSMKESATPRLAFNVLYRRILEAAGDPVADPAAAGAAPADPAAAGAAPAPGADPAAGLPDPNANPDAALGEVAGTGMVGQIEEAVNALGSTISTIQDQAAQQSLQGVLDTLNSVYEMLTGTPMAGAEGEAGAEEGGISEVPNMEQTPPEDPNAAGGGIDPNAGGGQAPAV